MILPPYGITADLPALLALRAIAGDGNPPAHCLLAVVETGRSGTLPLGANLLTTFVLRHTHQFNHPKPSQAFGQGVATCGLCGFLAHTCLADYGLP